MSCTKHFLNLKWEHHSWRPRVTLAESLPSPETSMWGRPINREYVRCHKQEVCEHCGTTRGNEGCFCDAAQAECCAVRLAWLDRSDQPAK